MGVINFRAENDSTRWAAPNKMFDYMAAGLALLVPDLPFMSRLVNEAACGLTFTAGDSESLKTAVRWLAENQTEVARMKENSLRAARAYSWEAQAPKLVGFYSRILALNSDESESS